jgi:hypothetical protein
MARRTSHKGSKKKDKSSDRRGEKKKEKHAKLISCGNLCESGSAAGKVTKKGAMSPAPSAVPTVHASAQYDPSEPDSDFSLAPSNPPSATMLDVDDQLGGGFNFSSAPSNAPSGLFDEVEDVLEGDFNFSVAPSDSPRPGPSYAPSRIPSVTPTLVTSNEPSQLPSMSPTFLIETDTVDREKDDESPQRVSQRTMIGSMVALAAAVGSGLVFHFKPRRP